jgi:hypothetical protein
VSIIDPKKAIPKINFFNVYGAVRETRTAAFMVKLLAKNGSGSEVETNLMG